MTTTDAVACPFCSVASAELVSVFGSQLLLSQYRCTACGSYFEGLREDRWEAQPGGITTGVMQGDEDGSRAEQ